MRMTEPNNIVELAEKIAHKPGTRKPPLGLEHDPIEFWRARDLMKMWREQREEEK